MSAHLRQVWAALVKTTGYWEEQPITALLDEWEFLMDRPYGGIRWLNDKYDMWGKTWPVYRGPGTSSFLAHEGIAYYGALQTLLEIERIIETKWGDALPERPDLVGAGGEVHPGR